MKYKTRTIFADTFLKRLLGLRRYSGSTTLILPNCRTIHTFGMKRNIEVIFQDKDNKELKRIHKLKPNRIAIGPKSTKNIIEIIH